MPDDVKKSILSDKIIAIIRNVRSEQIEQVAEAILKGHIRCLELALSGGANYDEKDVLNSIERIRKKYDGQIYVGAGTILTVEQMKSAYNSGAQYMIWLLYTSYDERAGFCIKTVELYRATSEDGIHWKSDCENPVFSREIDLGMDEPGLSRIDGGPVFYDEKERNEHKRLKLLYRFFDTKMCIRDRYWRLTKTYIRGR